MFCNRTELPKTHMFRYPIGQGAYRCTWLDHPLLNISDVHFEKNVILPNINKEGIKK